MTQASDRSRRADAARERAAELDAALLVTNASDIAWLTGLHSSNAAVCVTSDQIVLSTDARYADAVEADAADQLRVGRAVVDEVLTNVAGPVAIDIDAVNVATLNALDDREVVQVEGLLRDARAVKSPTEIDALRQACQLSVDALEQLIGAFDPTASEVVIARQLELFMGSLGAQDRAFETIVASGPNSAVPHHSPTQRVIEAGDLLKIDFGAMVDAYHADCTRTFVFGSASGWQQEIHEIVDGAAASARAAVRPGIRASELDAIARDVIAQAGYAENFGHGLGHGVGMDIHEFPILTAAEPAELRTGMVITIEPGIYLPGRGGVRIEDTVLVTQTGCEVLTEFPRELQTIG